VLAGRSAPTEAEPRWLVELRVAGATVEYRSLDVTNADAVTTCVREVVGRYGRLDGVIHAAGVTRDAAIVDVSAAELEAVLAPKVEGTINLDLATERERLDFFMVFSSLAAAVGNPGQSSYAVANAFADEYMRHREHLAKKGLRHGRSLSINWPLWRDGGLRVSTATLARLQRAGVFPLPTDRAIDALYGAWASGRVQVIVFCGERQAALRMSLVHVPTIASAPSGEVLDEARDEPDLVANRLVELVAAAAKLPVSQLDPDQPLELFGLDSLLVVELNRQLEQLFPDLSKVLFYQFSTLRALGEHLLAEYPDHCRRWLGVATASQDRALEPPDHDGGPASSEPTSKPLARDDGGNAREPIAIIGISGQYPQARNLAEYWANLRSGNDCITEIPRDRWPLAGFYEPNADLAVEQGKSYTKWGGFVEGFAEFDPLFFGISPAEAFNIDPQERLFLQTCWHVLEDAGYTRETIATRHRGRVGVYAGITKTGFELHRATLERLGERAPLRTSFGSAANRVSYYCDFHGPSMPIDTMCSASLTAVHVACEALLRSECEPLSASKQLRRAVRAENAIRRGQMQQLR
jgi:polyketide synthase PksN